MRIEADLVRQLAELLNQNDLTEIEVEDGDRKIKVRRELFAAAAPAVHAVPIAAAPVRVTSPTPGDGGTAYGSWENVVTVPPGLPVFGAWTEPNMTRSDSACAS